MSKHNLPSPSSNGKHHKPTPHRFAWPAKTPKGKPPRTGGDDLEIFRCEDIFQQIRADIATMGLVGQSDNGLLVYLICTSRILPEPAAGVVRGPTGSGKSREVNVPAKLFPSSVKIDAMQLTPASLYRLPKDRLRHKVIISGERKHSVSPESRDVNAVLRQLLSESA